jgi:hypothetical protein
MIAVWIDGGLVNHAFRVAEDREKSHPPSEFARQNHPTTAARMSI